MTEKVFSLSEEEAKRARALGPDGIYQQCRAAIEYYQGLLPENERRNTPKACIAKERLLNAAFESSPKEGKGLTTVLPQAPLLAGAGRSRE